MVRCKKAPQVIINSSASQLLLSSKSQFSVQSLLLFLRSLQRNAQHVYFWPVLFEGLLLFLATANTILDLAYRGLTGTKNGSKLSNSLPPTPVEDPRGSRRIDMTSNPSNAESPRPTVARAGRSANGLEQIVARQGFKLLNYSHSNSPVRDAPEEILTAIERFRISDPLQQPMPSSARSQDPPSYKSLFDNLLLEQHPDNYSSPYHRIDGDNPVAEADAAEQVDRDPAALGDKAGCGATGGRVQSSVINEIGVQAWGGMFYDSNVGQEGEELRAGKARDLLGVEGQTSFGRTPCLKTSTVKPPDRASPPPVTLCKPGDKLEKGEQEQNGAKRARVIVLAANVHIADTDTRGLNTGD